MTADAPSSSSSGLNGDHEHAGRCLEDGDRSEAWAFDCTICHSTRAGLRAGISAHVESAFDVMSEQRQASVDERERALDVRQSRAKAQETRQIQGKDEVENVAVKAAIRAAVSDARDAAAAQRYIAPNVHAWLNGMQDCTDTGAAKSPGRPVAFASRP